MSNFGKIVAAVVALALVVVGYSLFVAADNTEVEIDSSATTTEVQVQ